MSLQNVGVFTIVFAVNMRKGCSHHHHFEPWKWHHTTQGNCPLSPPCSQPDDGGHGGTVTTQLPDPSAIMRQLTSLFLRLSQAAE